jgi:O-antigen/teichoic acid export membrane protein
MLKYFTVGSWQEKLAQVGLFGAAAKIPILMTLFTQAFNYAVEPFFFKHAHREDAKAVYAQVAQAFTLVGSLVFAGIMLYLDLVAFLIGPNYREAIGIVPILLLAYLLLGIYYSFSVWFKLTDNTHIGGYIALGGSAITLLLNILLIPRWGYFGPAWAALACYGFMITAVYFTGQKRYPIPYPIGRMALYLLGGFGAYGLGLLNEQWFGSNLWVKLGANTAVLALFLVFLLYLERRSVIRLMNPWLKPKAKD